LENDRRKIIGLRGELIGFFLQVLLVIVSTQVTCAQEDIFNVIFQQNFEHTPTGTYETEQWKNDWNRPEWENGLSRTQVVEEKGNRVMKFNYPKGSVSPMNGGGQWLSNFGAGQEEVYFSYNVMFKPGFKWVLGGKLPGLGGGSNPGGGTTVDWDDGFSVRIMWNRDEGPEGTCFFYVYHQGKTSTYGDVFQCPNSNLDVSDSIWHNLTIRLVLNSIDQNKLVTDPVNAGNKDGLMELFLNGRLIYSATGMWFRNLNSIWVDTQHITSFFGGNTDEWAAQRDEWVLFDDFTVFTYNENVDVPRGRVPSKPNRVLELPNLKIAEPDPTDNEPPSVPEALKVTEVTGFSVGLEWEPSVDNVYLKGYRIFLEDEEQGTSVNNSFVLVGLVANTTYNVAVSAFDASSNESARSELLEVTTVDPDLEPPTTPANLQVIDSTDHSLMVAWDRSTDNIGVKGYNIYLNGRYEGTTVNTVYSILELDHNSEYAVSVSAFDESSNESPLTIPRLAHTKVSDNTPPSVPNGLTATIVTQNSAGLIWNASVDNINVSGYNIYLNDLRKGISNTSSFTLTNLTPGLNYNIKVTAFDGSANESLPSSAIQITTKNPDETSVPKLPEVEIVDVYNQAGVVETVSKINSYGHVLIEDFGVLVEKSVQSTHNEEVVFAAPGSASLNHEGRVSQGLQLMYDFANGTGSEVSDVSGMGSSLDLLISDPFATSWVPGQGLRVLGNTRICSEENSSKLAKSISSSNEITLEAWIKPAEIYQSGPAPILTLTDGEQHTAAMLGQVGNNAFFEYTMVLNNAMNSVGSHEVMTDSKFISLHLQHLIYTRDNHGIEKVFVNGVEMCSGYYDIDLSIIGEDVQLVLASGVTGEKPWHGTYYLVAVYNEALNHNQVLQNYLAGYGEIQFHADIALDPNVNYSISPFVRTDQGIVFGQSRSFLVENVLFPDENDSIHMAIYPNPSNGDFNLHIEFPDNLEGKSYIQVADMTGNVVYTELIQLPDVYDNLDKRMSLSSIIKTGVYTLNLVFTSRRSIGRRLIIQ